MKKDRRKKIVNFMSGCVTIIVVLVVWEILVVTGVFGHFDEKTIGIILPSPMKVAKKLWEIVISGYLGEHIWTSMKRIIIGFVLAFCIAVPMGIVMGANPVIKRFIYPLIKIIAPIPGVAWVPLAIIWFGLGNDAAIFIITVSVVTPICVNTMLGVESIDPVFEDLLFVLNANFWQKIIYLIVPSVTPYIITGLKLGLGYAWRVVLAAEMVGVPGGLGYVLNLGRSTAQTEITFIVIIVIGILMNLMEKILISPIEAVTNTWKVKTD